MSRPGIQKCRMTFPRHPHHMRAAAQMMALAENTVTWFGLNGNIKKKETNHKVKRNMPACIIYTSGTSGTPKGVILSHGGILSNGKGAVDLLATLPKKKDPVFLT